MSSVQGGNFLLNIFFGVSLNAAMAIYIQVSNAVNQFTMTFFSAVFPQITKSLAKENKDYFYNLIIRSSKFGFLLCFLFMFPLALQIDFVLGIWLKIVPDWAGIFCVLGIIYVLIYIPIYPVWHGILATGLNKKFRIIDSSMIILILPCIYIGLHYSPIGYFYPHIFVTIIRVIYAVFYLRKLTNFSIRKFASQSLLKCLAVVSISAPLPLYITSNMSGWQGFLTSLAAFFVIFVPCVLFIGLNGNEREKVVGLVKGKFWKWLVL